LVIDFDPGGMARPESGLPGGRMVSLALPMVIVSYAICSAVMPFRHVRDAATLILRRKSAADRAHKPLRPKGPIAEFRT
jgi:polyferredoxin